MHLVEAYTASWIEMINSPQCGQGTKCRGLYSLVDWNLVPLTASASEVGRGLYSLVDWNLTESEQNTGSNVEAYTASWIEICNCACGCCQLRSRLIQPRGLKSGARQRYQRRQLVEAYTASWIVIAVAKTVCAWRRVEAYTASWIEMSLQSAQWKISACRGLYSLVDWNAPTSAAISIQGTVEAYTASWVEIAWDGRTYIKDTVEAYTASWIEIFNSISFTCFIPSRLIQPRGLKFKVFQPLSGIQCRGLYSLVDWNIGFLSSLNKFRTSRLI